MRVPPHLSTLSLYSLSPWFSSVTNRKYEVRGHEPNSKTLRYGPDKSQTGQRNLFGQEKLVAGAFTLGVFRRPFFRVFLGFPGRLFADSPELIQKLQPLLQTRRRGLMLVFHIRTPRNRHLRFSPGTTYRKHSGRGSLLSPSPRKWRHFFVPRKPLYQSCPKGNIRLDTAFYQVIPSI